MRREDGELAPKFPRPDFRQLGRYETGRVSVEVELGDNTNLWGAHPAALERLKTASLRDLVGYPDTYAETLCEAVAERHCLPPGCVATGPGSDAVLDYAMRTAGPRGSVRYPAPTFSMVAPMAIMNGLVPTPVSWVRAFADPESLFEGDPAAVYVCRPNNPTGELAPRSWLDEIMELAERRAQTRPGRAPLLLVDEAYAEYSGDTTISLAPAHPRLVVLRTLSKVYGLAGLRCGYGVASSEVALEIDKARGPFTVSRLAAEAASAAISSEPEWTSRVVRESIRSRERLRRRLEERGFAPKPSHANFLLFPAPGGSARRCSEALIREGVWVRPFRRSHGLPDSLRVTVGPWPLMERFLEALDKVVEDMADGEGC